MSTPANFPGNRGEPATTPSAAAIISAFAFPTIERFVADLASFAELPDFPSPSDSYAANGLPVLTKVDVARSVIDDCVEILRALKVCQDATAACKAAVIERLDSAASAEASVMEFDQWQRDTSEMAAKAEVATTLSITEVAAGMLISTSTTLVREQPCSFAALAAGQISWGHAVVIAQESNTLRTVGVGTTAIADYESALLERAAGSTLPSFRDRARRLREKSHPESITARSKNAYSLRRMSVDRSQDGMSWLNLYLPAPTVEGIWDLTSVISRAAQGPDESRTLTQLRADVASSLLLCQTLASNRIHPQLAVHLPGPQDGVYYGGPAEDTATEAPAGIPDDVPAGELGDGGSIDDREDPREEDPWEHEIRSGGSLSGTAVRGIRQPGATVPETVPADVYEVLLGPVGGSFGGSTGRSVTGSSVTGDSRADQDSPRRDTSRDSMLPPMPSVLPIITIPVLSLLGLSNAPAELEGYGPISVDVAKRLTANAPTFYRVLTDPMTGEALAMNPESRRVTKKMRAFLRAQDEHCSFPGCQEKSALSDYDHITAWANGGKTTAEEVEPLCRRHHKVKHFKDDLGRTGQRRENQSPERSAMRLRGWTPNMTDSGRPGWTSPTGRYIPPEPRQPQVSGYPKWLKKWLDRTITASSSEQQETPDPSAPFHAGALDLSPAEAMFSMILGD